MPGAIDRRTFLFRSAATAGLGAAALSAGGLLAACGSSSTSPAASASAASKPRLGGNLRIGTWTEETALLPLKATWDGVGYDYGMALYDPLVVVADDGTVLPYLAQSVKANPDYTQWTITLRPGIKYSDGSPLDSANLVANFQTFKASPSLGYILAPVKTVKATGPLSVLVTMSDPWVPFDTYLTTFWPNATKTLASSYKGPPVGTGPFLYKSWQPNSHLYVTKNPNYWRKGLPYLDQVSFLPMLNSQQKENALSAGDIDIALVGNTIDNLTSIQQNSKLHFINTANFHATEPDMIYFLLNCAVAPTNDVRVRNALANATDQTKFWSEYFVGSGGAGGPGSKVPVTGPFAPGNPYYEFDTGYPAKQNIAKAKSLIASYAAEHGTPKITVTVSTEPKELTAAELIQSMWQEAGVKVTIQQLDVSTLIVRGLQGQTQAVFWDYGTTLDPDQNMPAWSPLYTAKTGTIALEETRLQDPRIQPLLNTGRTSPDKNTRINAYKQLARVFGELTPFIYMGRGFGGLAASQNVQNLSQLTTPDGNKITWAQAGIIPSQIWLA